MTEKKDLGATDTGMQPNLAAMLSYVMGFVSGLIFFLLEKKNKFVRFHAMQSILLSVAMLALMIIYGILGVIPIINLLVLILIPLTWLGGFILWIILLVKSFQGEKFKIPVLGDIAEKNAEKTA